MKFKVRSAMNFMQFVILLVGQFENRKLQVGVKRPVSVENVTAGKDIWKVLVFSSLATA